MFHVDSFVVDGDVEVFEDEDDDEIDDGEFNLLLLELFDDADDAELFIRVVSLDQVEDETFVELIWAELVGAVVFVTLEFCWLLDVWLDNFGVVLFVDVFVLLVYAPGLV